MRHKFEYLNFPDFSGWLWLALAGSGWLWLALAGSGWLWLALASSGWLWLALAGPGWRWRRRREEEEDASSMCFVHKQKQRHTPLPKNIYINKLPIVRPCGHYVNNNNNLREFALLTYGRAGAMPA